MATRKEVASFLSEAKTAIQFGHYRWVQRADESKAHLSGLEITQDQVLEHIIGLTPDDYSRGPEVEDYDETDIWVFGCLVGQVEAYIKLTMKPDRNKRTVLVVWIWSYHEANHPMKYPLRT